MALIARMPLYSHPRSLDGLGTRWPEVHAPLWQNCDSLDATSKSLPRVGIATEANTCETGAWWFQPPSLTCSKRLRVYSPDRYGTQRVPALAAAFALFIRVNQEPWQTLKTSRIPLYEQHPLAAPPGVAACRQCPRPPIGNAATHHGFPDAHRCSPCAER